MYLEEGSPGTGVVMHRPKAGAYPRLEPHAGLCCHLQRTVPGLPFVQVALFFKVSFLCVVIYR